MHPGAVITVLLAVLASTSMALGGCGQVMTRNTPTVPPPTATLVTVVQEVTRRATATPAPYTPAPTATPTITPTPIVYVVQQGDNMLRIAADFEITAEALQQANGITDPRSLQIGQRLVIPREAPPGQGTATPTATPLTFAVENVSFNHTPLGGLWCYGEIVNTTGTDLEQAAVTVLLRGENGKSLAQVQAHSLLDLVAPGKRAPFAVRFPEPPASFGSYLITPYAGMRGYLGSYYRDLVVRETSGSGERYAAYTVSGVVANTGPEDAVDVNLTVTLYDALGRVVGTRRAPPDHNVIPRGGQTTFAYQLTPAGGPVASYRVDALGRRLPKTPAP